MSDADNAVLDAVEKTIMSPTVVARALALAEAEIVRDGTARKCETLAVELAQLEAEVGRLMAAIKRGGDLDPLLDAIRESEARRADLRHQIAALEATSRSPRSTSARSVRS